MPANDPTLLFTAAGMAPFKAEFAGIAKPISPRITTCQKCLRADDIEKVGLTTRHHTFFEMLGNFSFGDYFKLEAIEWAWELLTAHYHLPAEKLWVSVHTDDDEAYGFWNTKIGIPAQKLFRLPDNFWGPVGATGPCGPDSEIYYDRGPQYSCGKPDCKPGCENLNSQHVPCDRFLELWNLVFTMYHKDEAGKLHDLPKKNIDTGAGLERITMVLQEKDSPFETDLFIDLVEHINPNYFKSNWEIKVATRIVADHLRAVTFVLAEGVTPSNEGRGYVLQKILRRALLNRMAIPGSPAFADLAEHVVSGMEQIYPELKDKVGQIKFYIHEGEKDFEQVMAIGNELLLQELRSLVPENGKKVVPGALLFRFHDERGFPFEFAKDFLEAKGYQVDEQGFKSEMEKQRLRSRGARQATDVMARSLKTQTDSLPATQFLGYQQTESEARVLTLLRDHEQVDELNVGQKGLVVLDKTPFYAESGGQVGDTGTLSFEGGGAQVLDVQKNDGETFFHQITVTKGALQKGSTVQTIVNRERREEIRKHHSATHLLHASLRTVLGPHVQQAGSFVCDQYLRLDFSHPKSLSMEELLKIEALVNEKILENFPIETAISSREEAKRQGALAFFGEKYGEKVRIVKVNEFSQELCGGTHARFTGELGPFVILAESSIAKGIRRIEAKAGRSAIAYLGNLQLLRFTLTDRLKVDSNAIPTQLEQILADRADKEKEIARLKQQLARYESESFLSKVQSVHGIPTLLELVSVGEKENLRAMVDALKEKMKSGVVMLAANLDGKAALVCGVTEDLVKRGFSAVEFVKEASLVVGGGGGGRNDMAEAGGKDPSRIQEAFKSTIKLIERGNS